MPDNSAASMLLVIEDNPAQLATLTDILTSDGLTPIGCLDGKDALAVCQQHDVYVAILDLWLPDMDGLAVLQQLKECVPDMKVIINTAYASVESAMEAVNRGAFAYVQKMGDSDELLGHVHRAFHAHLADYSERLKQEITESEQRFQQIIAAIHEVFWMAAPGFTQIFSISPAYELIWQRPRERLLTHPQEWLEAIHPDDIGSVQANWAKQRCGIATTEEFRIISLDGTLRWIRNRAYPILEANGDVAQVTGLAEDITERKQAEENLKAALQQKTLLLREVQHRTRNNMAVLSALLNFQASTTDNASVQHCLNALQSRIDAMAMIHEQFHQENLMIVNLRKYIEDLAHALIVKHAVHPERMACAYDVEPLTMVIDPAVSFGLLLHELISNALQHGFPQHQAGEIQISLHALDDGQRELRVRDTGVGLPADIDVHHPRTLGFQLIKLLTHSLGGNLDVVRRAPGTEMVVRFHEPEYKQRI